MKELIEGLELLKNGTVADKLTFLFHVYDLDGKDSVMGQFLRTRLDLAHNGFLPQRIL